MLEASKRKTVAEIEKKFAESSANIAFVCPRTLPEGGGIVPDYFDEDSRHASLDLDFYNLNH